MRGSIEHGCNEVRCGVAGARMRGSISQTDGEDSFGVARHHDMCKGTIIWLARHRDRKPRAKGERNSSQDYGNVASGDRKH